MLVGYARVSTDEQNLARQMDASGGRCSAHGATRVGQRGRPVKGVNWPLGSGRA